MIRIPIQATLYITNHCQLFCDHCFFVDQGLIGKKHMPTDMVFKILDEFARKKIFMIVVSGGDPTLHPDFKKIIKQMNCLKLLPLLGVTGVELSSATIEFLLSHKIKHLQISLDAFKNRGIGITNARVVGGIVDRNIDLLHMLGMKVTVAVCLHKENVIDVKPLVKYLLGRPIHKLKIVFWDKTTHGTKVGLHPIGRKERKHVIELLSKLDDHRDIIICPGYAPLSTGITEPQVEDQMRLVVLPDGNIATSETVAPIGHANAGEILPQYIEYKFNLVSSKIKQMKNQLMKRYNITGLWKIPRAQLGGSGGIIDTPESIYILIADDLDDACSFFVILHEIGHKVLRLTKKNPKNNKNLGDEHKVNEWCVEQLRPFITTKFYNNLKNILSVETKIFKLISQDLYMNFVGDLI